MGAYTEMGAYSGEYGKAHTHNCSITAIIYDRAATDSEFKCSDAEHLVLNSPYNSHKLIIGLSTIRQNMYGIHYEIIN